MLKQIVFSLYTHHLSVEVKRQDRFYKHREHPERFFLAQVFNESTKDKIHALAVPYQRVTLSVSNKYTPDASNNTRQLIIFFFWECSFEINFYLVKTRVWIVRKVIWKSWVIVAELRIIKVGLSSTANSPKLNELVWYSYISPKTVWNTFNNILYQVFLFIFGQQSHVFKNLQIIWNKSGLPIWDGHALLPLFVVFSFQEAKIWTLIF